MYSYEYQHRVRYRECDPMGVVYHTHYLDYFEAARTEALRAMGVPYKDLETKGIIMPVVDLAVQYKGPATYDDVLVITASFTDVPHVRVRIEYTVRRDGEDEVLATGHVTLCFVDTRRGRPIPAPDRIRTLFEQALVAG